MDKLNRIPLIIFGFLIAFSIILNTIYDDFPYLFYILGIFIGICIPHIPKKEE